METRRNFLRKAAVGSAVLSSVGGFSVLSAKENPDGAANDHADIQATDQLFPGWEISFNEPVSELTLKNGSVSLQGKLSFYSEENQWLIAHSRDGIQNRYALVDLKGISVGYFVFGQTCENLQLLFYHRYYAGKAPCGIFSFEGMISFMTDSFACRTRANADERVLSLGYGKADSTWNDSLFYPAGDLALRLDAEKLNIKTAEAGLYSFTLSGKIGELYKPVFELNLEKGYYQNRYIPRYHEINRKRCPKTPTGWMSWNTYFDTATAEDNLAEAKIGKKYLQPFGCEFWSIESWQENSDVLPVRNFYNMNLETSVKKFPKGMKRLAEDIRKLGFRPGIWTAPFGTGNREFYETHKDWFLHDENGEPIPSWNGRFTLDPTIPETREHLKKIHDIVSHEWGYEFFKIDGITTQPLLYEHPEIRARFRDQSCQNAFELCIRAIREGIGEDRVLLACGKPSGVEGFYSDAYRVGGDIVEQFKPPKWSGIVNTGRITANQIFFNNIVIHTDPDTLLVREMPLEEARVFTTLVALPGQLTFFGDKLAMLPADRMKMLQQTLPVADVHPMSLYPYFSMMPVWNLHVHNDLLDDYNVVALFNWGNEPASIFCTAEELGVDPEENYIMFEFWTQKSFRTMKGNLAMEVPAHAIRLLSMHKAKAFPQWISSDRHVTQNGMELKEYAWKAESRMLEGKIQLIGSFPLTMRLRIPDGYSFRKAECQGAECSATPEGDNILAITFMPGRTGDYSFKINF